MAPPTLPTVSRKPPYRQALDASTPQAPTVIFIAQKMFDGESNKEVANDLRQEYPGAHVIPVPEHNAQQFILEKIQSLAQKSPISQLIINAHGNSNHMVFGPGGTANDPTSNVSTHSLLDGILHTQENMRVRTGNKSLKITGNIKFDSCLILSNNSPEDIAKYQDSAQKLGAFITASASEENLKRAGNFYTFTPDGAVLKDKDPTHADISFQTNGEYFDGSDSLSVSCASQNPSPNCATAWTPTIQATTDATDRLIYKDEPSQRAGDIKILMTNAPNIPLKERMAAYFQASRVSYYSGDMQTAQLAADEWTKTINQLPAQERINLIRTHNIAIKQSNPDPDPLADAKINVMQKAQAEIQRVPSLGHF